MKIKLSNKLLNKIYFNNAVEETWEAPKEPLKIIKYLGQKDHINEYYNGIGFHYLAKDQYGLYTFTVYYNHKNKQFDYEWGAYIHELFPLLTNELLESFIENLNAEIMYFMYKHSEY